MKTNLEQTIKKISVILRNYYGCSHPIYNDIMEDITDNFYNWKTDKYEISEDGLFYVIRKFVNYDLISITQKYAIDLKNSNHSEIAKLLKPYTNKELIKQICESF